MAVKRILSRSRKNDLVLFWHKRQQCLALSLHNSLKKKIFFMNYKLEYISEDDFEKLINRGFVMKYSVAV
ncbi:hypothetical protein QUF70_11255 [Desulfobacterales bacterium HSG17]|nr:hypothetical protein [Desulfobacterales bacterium HSG17]